LQFVQQQHQQADRTCLHPVVENLDFFEAYTTTAAAAATAACRIAPDFIDSIDSGSNTSACCCCDQGQTTMHRTMREVLFTDAAKLYQCIQNLSPETIFLLVFTLAVGCYFASYFFSRISRTSNTISNVKTRGDVKQGNNVGSLCTLFVLTKHCVGICHAWTTAVEQVKKFLG
jgi:hypothetical protein